MDILVRRVDGKIVPLNGFKVLDNALSTSKEVQVKVVDTSENIIVIRDEYGDIVEKRKSGFTE